MSVRLPHKMLEDLKRLAGQLDMPYQTLMKQAIDTGMGVIRTKESRASERKLRREVRMSDTPHVNDSLNKLSSTRAPEKPKRKKKAAAKKKR